MGPIANLEALLEFDGATPAALGGFGVENVNVNGVGDYTVTFTNPVATPDKVVIPSTSEVQINRTLLTATTMQITLFDAAGAATDGNFMLQVWEVYPPNQTLPTVTP